MYEDVSNLLATSAPSSGFAFSRIVNFAAQHSPAYRDQAWARILRRGGTVGLDEIPLTQKSAVKDANENFFSDHVPREEGEVFEKFTSGSTGIPLKIPKTQRHFLINSLENARLHRGWGYDDHERKVIATNPSNASEAGKVEESHLENGSRQFKIASYSPEPIADLLRETRATFLSTLPSVALAVLQDNPDIDFPRLLSTVGEVVPPELTAAVASLSSCVHTDTYGSVETGIIAGLCKACRRYHVAHRHLIVELLDERGNRVGSGEMGQVVVTPLFNMAMPLIRYETGDFAINSREGPCDRKGMAFDRVLGRERNLFRLPDGSRVTPYFSPDELIELGIRRCKLVQTALTEVEFRYIPMNDGVTVSAEAAQRMIDIYVSPKLKAVPVKVSELPPAASGKYLMHESLI